MHFAGQHIPIKIQKKILAVVMFGDPALKKGAPEPRFPLELEMKLLQNCVRNDNVGWSQ
jgi:hypothetical protein